MNHHPSPRFSLIAFSLGLVVLASACTVRTSVRHGFYPAQTLSAQDAQRLAQVRILLSDDAAQVQVTCPGPVAISDLKGRAATQHIRLGSEGRVVAQNHALVVDHQFMASDRVRIQPEGDAILKVNGVRYRGALDLVLTGSKDGLRAINWVHVEDYLKGVVPNEMPYTSPLEALKAQAVAARTFTYSRMAAQNNAAFDLEANTNSQVYHGVDSERPSTNQAVTETTALVAVYRGQYLSAFYHANCGGHTADVAQVWGGDAPYLSGVACGFCDSGPHHAWSLELPLDEVAKALAHHGQPGGPVQALQVLSRFPDGRVDQIEIARDGGTVTLKAPAFRQMLGPDRIRSTNFEVQALGSSVRFQGRGWGHGVGMCQEGAVGQARAGYRFEEILRYYYPGSDLRRLDR
jgi:stage II sporulation protein D